MVPAGAHVTFWGYGASKAPPYLAAHHAAG
jgi:hypothetical protein